jgi:hypothetical protein
VLKSVNDAFVEAASDNQQTIAARTAGVAVESLATWTNCDISY